MMTLPILAAGAPPSTASAHPHEATKGTDRFSELLQQVNTTVTEAVSPAVGHAENGKVQVRAALQGARREAAHKTTKDANRTASGVSSVSSKGEEIEKSNLKRRRALKTESVKAPGTRPAPKHAAAAPETTAKTVAPTVPVPAHIPQDDVLSASNQAAPVSASTIVPDEVLKTPAAIPSPQTSSAFPQKSAADVSGSSGSDTDAQNIASNAAQVVSSDFHAATLVADPASHQVKPAVSEAIAARRAQLSAESQAEHTLTDDAAADAHLAVSSARAAFAETFLPHSSSSQTNIAKNDSLESNSAARFVHSEAAKPDASSPHTNSTGTTGGHDLSASITASTGTAAHAASQSSQEPIPQLASGQPAAHSAMLQSVAVAPSATPASHGLTLAPQTTAHTAPTAATPSSPVLDSAQLRMGENSNQLKISVQLPELGKVEVRAVSAHDVTTAHLTAFRSEALPVLAESRAALEQALKTHDVVLGSLNSHASNSQAQSQSGGSPQQQSQRSPDTRSGSATAMAGMLIPTSSTEAATASLPEYSSISVLA